MVIGTAAIVWGAETFAETWRMRRSDSASRRSRSRCCSPAPSPKSATVITASARTSTVLRSVTSSNQHGDRHDRPGGGCLHHRAAVRSKHPPLRTRRSRHRCTRGGADVGRHRRSDRGAVLVLADVAFVAVIWLLERRPPTLGEAGELDEAVDPTGRVGSDLGYVIVGLAALTLGSIALVEGVRRLTDVEATQTRLGLTIVGFATAFELVVLAFSASRHCVTEAVVAGVVGSYAYNMTMSLGVGNLVAPVGISDRRCCTRPSS